MSLDLPSASVTAADEGRFRANLQGEIDSAVVYRAMAKAEKSEELSSVYERLAEVEERHLDFWEEQLRTIGAEPRSNRPSWRARTMALLACRFGPRVVLPTVATFEQVDQGDYDDQPETAGTGMRDEERSHARLLAAGVTFGLGHLIGAALA
jgi:demethoxyubiquinone hydroxylase (CLK1/Coq7/Cat5 family)